jgi:hypothetical protein
LAGIMWPSGGGTRVTYDPPPASMPDPPLGSVRKKCHPGLTNWFQ